MIGGRLIHAPTRPTVPSMCWGNIKVWPAMMCCARASSSTTRTRPTI